MKIVRIWGFSGPYFPALGLNMEKYGVSLHIQPECRKIRTRKTPNMDTFHAVQVAQKMIQQLQHPIFFLLQMISRGVFKSFQQKYLKAFNHLLFLQNAPSQVLDRVLNMPLGFSSYFNIPLIHIYSSFQLKALRQSSQKVLPKILTPYFFTFISTYIS